MLRTLSLCAALLLANGALAQPSVQPPVQASDLAQRVWRVMEMEQMMPILRDEALAESEGMAEMLFLDGGTDVWRDQVGAIHDPLRMQEMFVEGMTKAAPSMNGERIEDALDFYETDLGKRIMGLEVSSRIAFLDKAVEQDARDTYAREAGIGSPLAGQIDRLIEAGDLVDPNVVGALNAVIAFSNGFNDGGGYPMPMSEDQILSDAWAQEPQVRQDTVDWMSAYLMLTYSPLSDDEMEEFIDFAQTEQAMALAGLLFAGFDHAFRQTSYELGLAAAGQLGGRKL